MKENEKPRRTIYELVRDDLIESHPRILNLLLGLTLVSLSFMAIFLASDILSSGSHAIHQDGLGGRLLLIPKETLSALKNWQSEAFDDHVKINDSNGSSKTPEEGTAVRNVSLSGPEVSITSSQNEPDIALGQTSSTGAAIAASIAGSTKGSSALIAKRHNSGGDRVNKVVGNESKSIKPQLNESKLNKTQFNESNLNKTQLNESKLKKSQLNVTQFNKSQLDIPMLNESKSDSSPSNGSLPIQPQAIEPPWLNASQLNQSQPNESGSANQSQTVASQLTKASIMDTMQNKSSQYTSQADPSKANQSESANKSQEKDLQASQADLTNRSRPSNDVAEPMKESGSIELPPDQSVTLSKTEGEIGMPPQAGAAANNDAGSSLLTHDDGGKPAVAPSAGSSAVAQSGTNSIESSTMNSEPKANGASPETAAREINPTSAMAAPQEIPAEQKIGEGPSVQSKLQTGSSSPDHSSGAASSADAGKGGDKPVIETLKFDSSQETDGSKVSPDSSGTSGKTVSASKSSAEAGNAKKDEASKQYRPIRAPRKPVPPRQVRSASRR
jgi:hypothetical protein